MTETEFHAALEPLLSRHPFVPIRVDGEGGPILFVDNPYRADLFEGTLTILHKDEGRRPVAEVKAEQVVRVIPVDQLPAEPGCLSYREFHATAAAFHWATPFQPFVVELIDGTRYVAEKQGQITFGGRYGTYFGSRVEGWKRFAVAEVVRIQAVELNSKGPRTTNRVGGA